MTVNAKFKLNTTISKFKRNLTKNYKKRQKKESDDPELMGFIIWLYPNWKTGCSTGMPYSPTKTGSLAINRNTEPRIPSYTLLARVSDKFYTLETFAQQRRRCQLLFLTSDGNSDGMRYTGNLFWNSNIFNVPHLQNLRNPEKNSGTDGAADRALWTPNQRSTVSLEILHLLTTFSWHDWRSDTTCWSDPSLKNDHGLHCSLRTILSAAAPAFFNMATRTS